VTVARVELGEAAAEGQAIAKEYAKLCGELR